ncbi:metallophosphoesterase family protein [Roseisolibacter agri]|uniref:metallophosphoesterase family protein n=1 Tax=Roseisolibacter agri TaxID=2014610 RepID=UPI0024E06368|nr:metallophosphoesterase [Roseisolibacter agri]
MQHALALACITVGASCRPRIPPALGAEPLGDVQTTVLLIGDAGDPGRHARAGAEPVLRALARAASERADRTTVVFLGDNVYDDGVPPEEGSPGHARAESILRRQLTAEDGIPPVVRRIFVPGNHDWNDHGRRRDPRGADRVRAQRDVLRRLDGSGAATLSPPASCPGPEVHDVGPRLRLVALDSEWWLQPGGGAGACTESGVPHDSASSVDALRAATATAGDRHVVVVAHHPLLTGGEHGGHCTRWLSLCSIKRLFSGGNWQDTPSRANARMRQAITAALRDRPALLYAAGHDHTLQVLRGTGGSAPAARYLAVSGAGIYGNQSQVKCLDESLAAIRAPGFMRLDVRADGSARLTVLTVDRDGNATERARVWLTRDDSSTTPCGR